MDPNAPSILLYLVLNKPEDFYVPTFFNELITLSAFSLLLFGWAIVPGFRYALWATKKGRIERQKDQEVSSIREDSLLRQTPLEEKLKLAKKERERTEAALKVLIDNAKTLAAEPVAGTGPMLG